MLSFIATATVAVLSSASDFPKDSSFHAYCNFGSITVDAPNAKCSTVLSDILSFVNTGADPASPAGTYTLVETGSNYVWANRTTANKKYTDDIIWQSTNDQSPCTFTAKSRSQSLSYYDYGVNYCNVYNGIQAVAEKASYKAEFVTADCKFPGDATKCERY